MTERASDSAINHGKLRGISRVRHQGNDKVESRQATGGRARGPRLEPSGGAAETKLLLQLGAAVRNAQPLNDVFSMALDVLMSAPGAPRAAVLTLGGDGRMQFKAFRGLSEGCRQALTGYCPWAPDGPDPKPLYLVDVLADPTWSPFAAPFRVEGIRALGFVPLVNQQRLHGSFVLYGPEARAFSDRALSLVELVATMVAPALGRSELARRERLAQMAAERSAERLHRFRELIEQLWGAASTAQVASAMVLEGVSATGASRGGLWLSSYDGGEPERIASYCRPGHPLANGVALEAQLESPVLEVLRTGSCIWITSDKELRERYPELPDADEPAFSALACLPILTDGGCEGALAYTFDTCDALDGSARELLLDLLQQGQRALERTRTLERERARRVASEAALARTCFEADANARLASSFDYETTLRNVTRVAVNDFADCAMLELGDSPGRSILVAVEHVDAQKAALAWELRARYSSDPSATRGVPGVLRTGQGELLNISDGSLVREARDAEHLALLRAQGHRSTLTVPVTFGGRAMGALSFARTESRAPYAAADLELAARLGQRAGVAIENAKLHQDHAHALRTRDELLGVVSHDLRTPLAVISLTAQLLNRGLGDRDQAQGMISRIHANVDSMSRLIGDLLDVSSIEAGQMKLELRDEDLAELLSCAVEQLMPLAKPKGIVLKALRPAQRVLVRGDRERISRVLQNLIGNSIKFTPAGGAILVRSSREGSMVRLGVRDTGAGIDPVHLVHIFDRHYQPVPGEHDGVGLGLFIARSIVEAHGGHIWAENIPGKGCEFSFTLPLATGTALGSP